MTRRGKVKGIVQEKGGAVWVDIIKGLLSQVIKAGLGLVV